MADFARIAEELSTAKHMECSEDAWLISITLTFSFASAANNRIETPTTPCSPVPCTLSKLILLIDEMPLMIRSFPFPKALMIVPGKEGLNVFLTQIGMLLRMAGCMVAGKITFAPKCESSMAS